MELIISTEDLLTEAVELKVIDFSMESADVLEPFWEDIHELELQLDRHEQEIEKPLIRKANSTIVKQPSWKAWRKNFVSYPSHKKLIYVLLLVDGRVRGMADIKASSDYVNTGNVNVIVVHEDFRGKAFGTKLLNAAKGELKKRSCKFVTLGVSTNNPAQHLYQREGFAPFGFRMVCKL
jgi:ribosomal protein S18 acetylase RimI-like enzyme